MGSWVRAAVAGTAMLAAGPVLAQSMDGTWQGRIRCEASGTLGPLNAAIKVTIAGARASYERNIVNPSDTSKVLGTDTGSGAVTPDGQVRMSGGANGGTWRQSTEISGKLTGRNSTLGANITNYSRANNAGIERRCTITIQQG